MSRLRGASVLGLCLLGACRFDSVVPNGRLVCQTDEDCPNGGKCQESSITSITGEPGGDATVKLCCTGNGCVVAPKDKGDAALVGPDAADGGEPLSTSDAPSPDAGHEMATPDAGHEMATPDATAPHGPGPDGPLPNTRSSCDGSSCQYRCLPGWAACHAPIETAGCPTALSTPEDCGACGRSCAGCLDGQCPVEHIADKIGGGATLDPDHGAFHGNRLFFTAGDTNAVLSVGFDGATAGPVTTAAVPQRQPRVFGEYLYWHEGSGVHTIRRMSLAGVPGGPVETVVPSIPSPHATLYALGVVDAFLYWEIGSTLGAALKVVQRRRLDGGVVETILNPPEPIGRIFFDAAGFFWDRATDERTIRHAPAAGGDASDFFVKVDLDPPATHLRVLGTDAGFVYWHEGLPGGGSVRRMAKDGSGSPEILVEQVPHELGDDTIAVFDDHQNLFLVDRAGDVNAVVKGGGYLYNVALPRKEFAAFGIDGTHVYWLDTQGSLWRAPR